MDKEACGSMPQIMESPAASRKNFHFSPATTHTPFPLIAVGGDGCISVAANEAPKQFSQLIHACLKGNWKKRSNSTHASSLDEYQFHRIQSNSVKTALAMMGMIEESFRLRCARLPKRIVKNQVHSGRSEVDRIRRVSCFGSK